MWTEPESDSFLLTGSRILFRFSFSTVFRYFDLLFCLITIELKTESARRWSNKWTKILYQDYLDCIANFCRALLIIFSKQFISSNTKRRKRMLNFV